MSNFSPSIQFAKHWLNTPNSVKTAFKDELNDIIRLLNDQTPINEFAFTNDDFDHTISVLMQSKDAHIKHPTLVHSIDTTALSDASGDLTADELQQLENRLFQNLSGQVDGFLAEHTKQLSEDLRTWLRTTIKNELAAYKRQS